MLRDLPPFNIDILTLDKKIISRLRPVTSLSTMLPSSNQFDPNGLFSTEIFGLPGTEERMTTFGYIDLKVPIFHPLAFNVLSDIKKLYKEVMASTAYAIYNKDTKDLERSNIVEGKTGYEFFARHYDKLKYPSSNATTRKFNIAFIEKHKDKLLMDKLLVLPAGLRDYYVKKDGRPEEDSINSLYRRVISLANLIDPVIARDDLESLNEIRYKIQVAVFEIYDYIRVMLDGKKKFVAGKFARRAVFYTTRNVASPLPISITKLGDNNLITYNHTQVGMYQYLAATLPIAIKELRMGILSNIFLSPNIPANLIDKNTLQPARENIDTYIHDTWMSIEGLEKIIYTFKQEETRHDPVVVEDYYLALIYVNEKEKVFKVVHDINTVPDNIDKSLIRPISIAELFYITINGYYQRYPALVTRYPITGLGSTYPSKIYVKSTVHAIGLYELDNNWNKTDKYYPEFPLKTEKFYNTISPHPTHLGRLGMDFDGDTGSLMVLYTDEAVEEINKLFKQKRFYLDPAGKLAYSADYDTASAVVKAFGYMP